MTAAELQKLLDAATPGPWVHYADLPSVEPDWHIVTTANRLRVLANVHIETGNVMDEANARLIGLAPTLAARVIAAEKVVAAARELADATQLTWDHDYPEGADPLLRTRHALVAYDEVAK